MSGQSANASASLPNWGQAANIETSSHGKLSKNQDFTFLNLFDGHIFGNWATWGQAAHLETSSNAILANWGEQASKYLRDLPIEASSQYKIEASNRHLRDLPMVSDFTDTWRPGWFRSSALKTSHRKVWWTLYIFQRKVCSLPHRSQPPCLM